MKSLHNFINFLVLLDKKKKVLLVHMNKAQEKLKNIQIQLAECQDNVLFLKQKMASFYHSGEISKEKLYSNIKNQGRVLYKQQMLEQKIIQLESEALVENKIISQYRKEILKTDRRHKKLSLYINRQKYKKLLERNVRSENEIMELAAYDRENYREKYS
ncbi:hypothetical protein QUQ58_004624 [Escherichia coli]|nr:hypothetical protein [Escherichia coli]